MSDTVDNRPASARVDMTSLFREEFIGSDAASTLFNLLGLLSRYITT